MKGNICTRLGQITAYGDDILVLTRTKQILINIFMKLKEETKRYEQVVNERKGKCGRRETNENCWHTLAGNG